MNKRGLIGGFVFIFVLLFLIALYFYTDQTKEIVGMLVSGWEPVKLNLAQKSLTLQLSNITNASAIP